MLAVFQTSPRRQHCCRLFLSDGVYFRVAACDGRQRRPNPCGTFPTSCRGFTVERGLYLLHFFKGVFKSFLFYLSYLQPHKNIRIRIVVESVDADKARPLI